MSTRAPATDAADEGTAPVSLDEAFARHQAFFADRLAHPAPGAWAVTSPTGTGKTGGLARALIALDRSGAWPTVAGRPMRVLFLTPTVAAAEAFVAETGDLAMLARGRSADPASPFHCPDAERIAVRAERRHRRGGLCPASPGHGMRCGYRQRRHETATARLVAAPTARYLTAAVEIAAFDVVAVDEELLGSLLEEVLVRSTDIARWRRAAEAGWAEALARLEDLLDHRPRRRDRPWLPALAVLRAHDPGLIARLVALRRSLGARTLAPHERPDAAAGDELPLRATRALLDAVAAEVDLPAGADTRLWLAPEGLRIVRVRAELVRTLRARTVIAMDATPNPLLERLFPGMATLDLAVDLPLTVTQITDRLVTQRELAGRDERAARLRDRVARAIAAEAGDARRIAIFSFKRVLPDGDTPPRLPIPPTDAIIQWGQFGRDERALNGYRDADLLVIAGRYTAPINTLRAEVQAVRASPTPRPTGELRRTAVVVTRAGAPIATTIAGDRDDEVDAYVRSREAARGRQAIGRGRPASRPPGAPLRVLVMTRVPVAGLPVDRLTSLAELAGASTTRQPSAATTAARDRAARRRQEARLEPIEAAIAALLAGRQPVTFAAVARLSDVPLSTLTRTPRFAATIRAAQDATAR